MVMIFDVSCLYQIKVPAQTKKVALNARVHQDLHQVLSEYVKIQMNASKIMSFVRLDATILPVRFICYKMFSDSICNFNGSANHPFGFFHIGSYRCVCPYGYAVAPDRMHCEDIDECSTEANDCRYDCKNLIGSFM